MSKKRYEIIFSLIFIIALVGIFFWYIFLGKAHLIYGNNMDIFYPQWAYYRLMKLCEGGIPLWNPYIFSGMPYHADPQTYLFYPFAFFPLLFTVVKSFGMSAVFHFCIAGTGMYLYLRILRLGNQASIAGAVVYSMSGFMVSSVWMIVISNTAAWFPWIMLFSEVAWRRRDIRFVALAGISYALLFFAGHPQIFYYVGLFLVSDAMFRTFKDRENASYKNSFIRSFGLLAVLLVVTLLLSSVQFLPMFELLQYSTRSAGVGLDIAQRQSWTFAHLLTLIAPTSLGFNDGNHLWYMEIVGFVGISTLFFSAYALASKQYRSRSIYLFSVCILVFVLALGPLLPVYEILFRVVPYFSAFRMPTRLFILSAFSFAVLSAIGIDYMVQNVTKKRDCILGISIIGLFISVIIFILFRFDGTQVEHDRLFHTLYLLGVVVIGVIVLLKLCCVSRLRWLLGYFALALIIIDVCGNTIGHNYRTDNYDLPNLPTCEEFVERGNHLGDQRVLYPPQVNNDVLWTREEGISGYMALNLREYSELITPFLFQEILDAPFLDFLNVQKILRVVGVPLRAETIINNNVLPRVQVIHEYQRLRKEHDVSFFQSSSFFSEKTVYLNKDPIPPPQKHIVDDQSDDITINSYKEDRVEIQVSLASPGIVVLADAYYSGWSATSNEDDIPILIANRAFRAVALPEGEHNLIFIYSPLSVRVGATISIITIILILILFALSFKKSLMSFLNLR